MAVKTGSGKKAVLDTPMKGDQGPIGKKKVGK